jgi:hypothetical protein
MEGNYKKWINRINAKQDVLTEDNVGEFMDLELATKSTPSSGDTVLGRDSVTGKAVEIPTSSFGGGGSGLTLGETSSTAYRGDRGKTAYDHSQATGNLHNTKVEELTDVGSETTSITDTDVILKKEVGGLWRKINWANIKVALKTYFDDLYAPKSFNVKVTTPTSYVTNTVSETEVYRLPLPPGTFNPVDVLKIPLMLVKKLGINGTTQVRGKMSTSPTMPSGTTDLIFTTPVATAGNQTFGIIKTFFIDNGNIKGTAFTVPSYTDNNASAGVISEKPFDIDAMNYLYISVINGSANDQTRLEGFQLTNS